MAAAPISVTVNFNDENPESVLAGFPKSQRFDTFVFTLAVRSSEYLCYPAPTLDLSNRIRDRVQKLFHFIEEFSFSAKSIVLDIPATANGMEGQWFLSCQTTTDSWCNLLCLTPDSIEIREQGTYGHAERIMKDLPTDFPFKRKVRQLSFPAGACSEDVFNTLKEKRPWIDGYVMTAPPQGILAWMRDKGWMLGHNGAHVSDLLIQMEKWRQENPEKRKIEGCFHLTLDVIAHCGRMFARKPETKEDFVEKGKKLLKGMVSKKASPEDRLRDVIRTWISSSDDWAKSVSGDNTYRLLPMRMKKESCEQAEWIASYVKALKRIADVAGPETLRGVVDCKMLSRCRQRENGTFSDRPCDVQKRGACPHCLMYGYFLDENFTKAFAAIFGSAASLTVDMPSLLSVQAFSAIKLNFMSVKKLNVRMNRWIGGEDAEEGYDATDYTKKILTAEALSPDMLVSLETLAWEFPSALCPRRFLFADNYSPAFHYAPDQALEAVAKTLDYKPNKLSTICVKNIVPTGEAKIYLPFFAAFADRSLEQLTLEFPDFPYLNKGEITPLAKTMANWNVDSLRIVLCNTPHTIADMKPGTPGVVSGNGNKTHPLVDAYLTEAGNAILSG